MLHKDVLPKILKYLKTHGIIIAGWPGVGKTPWAKQLAMLLGRYWTQTKNLNRKKACFRRGKKIERFQKMPQLLWETLMLDDPIMEAIDIEDFKGFMELCEGGSGSGRYKDTKYSTP